MLAKIFSFKGRATRTTYWLGLLPLLLAFGLVQVYLYGLPALGIPAQLDTRPFSERLKTSKIRIVKMDKAARRQLKIDASRNFLILFIKIFGTMAPFWIISLSVTARRLHDRNKSGLWQLLMYIPLPVLLIPMIITALGLELPAFLQQAIPNGSSVYIFFLVGCYIFSMLASIKYLIELGFFGPKGDNPNKYGIDPRTTRAV